MCNKDARCRESSAKPLLRTSAWQCQERFATLSPPKSVGRYIFMNINADPTKKCEKVYFHEYQWSAPQRFFRELMRLLTERDGCCQLGRVQQHFIPKTKSQYIVSLILPQILPHISYKLGVQQHFILKYKARYIFSLTLPHCIGGAPCLWAKTTAKVSVCASGEMPTGQSRILANFKMHFTFRRYVNRSSRIKTHFTLFSLPKHSLEM